MDLKNREDTALLLFEEHVLRGKSFTLELVSNHSMSPFLLKGGLIIARRTSMDKLIPGDLIIYRQGGAHYCIHRFLYKRTARTDAGQNSNYSYLLITKGDNLIDLDPPVTEDRFIGRATAIRRGDREIRMENLSWRLINRSLGVISLSQLYALKFLLFIKNLFFKDREAPLANMMKRVLELPLKLAVLFTRLFTL